MGWKDSSVLEAVLHNAQTGNVDGIEIPVSSHGLLRVHVVAADSWDGTLGFKGSIDRENPVDIRGHQSDDDSVSTSASGATLNMLFHFDVSGLDWFKMPITGRSTGSVTVTARAVPA